MTDKFLKLCGVLWLLNTAAFAFLIAMPGRQQANAHPDIRGGGDWGFGGTDAEHLSSSSTSL